jgi:hypothetical protein
VPVSAARKRVGELWKIEQQPHDDPDGTTHLTHVVSVDVSPVFEAAKRRRR